MSRNKRGRGKKHIGKKPSQQKSTGRKSSFKNQIKTAMRSLILSEKDKSWDLKEFAKILNLRDLDSQAMMHEHLLSFAAQEFIQRDGQNKWRYNPMFQSEVVGVLDVSRNGAGFVIVEGRDEDIYISKKHIGNAFNRDEVRVLLTDKRKDRWEGEVIEVVKRYKDQWVGRLEMSKDFGFVVPDDPKFNLDFFIAKENLNGAKNGEKVVVSLVKWPEKAQNPYGKVEKILGLPGDNDTEIHSILEEFALPYEFPEAVEAEAAKISGDFPADEVAQRKDLRGVATFTIDPYDAKDFDDALSIEWLENGNFRIGIHIADVSYYVKEGSQLDQEAYNRGNSVYLVDRVVPMLPEVLSNGLCSLRPNEDKMTYSVLFEITPEAKVKDYWIGRTVTHSQHRFTYEEAQEIIEGKVTTGPMVEEVLQYQKLAVILRKKRLGEGALEITSKEVKFRLDEDAKPVGVFIKVTKEANWLIEEFMLLANQYVAKFMGMPEPNKEIFPLIYRVHDYPSDEKLKDFSKFAKSLGYQVNLNRENAASELSKLIKEVSDKPEGYIIGQMAIRTMMKAEYSPENIGHYGLAFQYYAHFTSPIRRYADLMVHRALEKRIKEKKAYGIAALEKISKHISATEKKASEAERASIKFKQAQYMADHIGESFIGMVSGVTEWGLYVELTELFCEGMVPVRSIPGDTYYVNEDEKCLQGYNLGEKIRIGDPVEIKVAKVDMIKKQIDFDLTKLPYELVTP